MSLNDKFKQAAEDVKRLKQKPNEDELLSLYALYKQSEVGDCNVPKPGMLDLKGKAKWEAWNGKKGLSKESAREQYVNLTYELVKKYGILSENKPS